MNLKVEVENVETQLKVKFESMVKELSEYSFYKLRGWLAHNFTDVLREFDENIIPWEEEEYLEKFREYIYNLQCDYRIQENILTTEVDQIVELFDFTNNETYKLILDAIEMTEQMLKELFIRENNLTEEVKLLEVNEEIQKDIEILETFIESIEIK